MTAAQHPSVDQLSDLVEGLLEEPDRSHVRQHVTECPSCRAIVEEVAGVRVLLQQAAVEQPPVPAHVADRLDAALTAESAQRSRETGVSSMQGHRRQRSEAWRAQGRLGRVFATAASVAVLAVGGGLVYQAISGSESSPGTDGPRASKQETSEPRGGATDSYTLADGTVRLTEESFDDKVRGAVRPEEAGKGATKGPVGPTNDVMGNNAQQERCLTEAVRGERSILDTTSASYRGEAAVLAITQAEQSGTVHAYVIVGCPGGGRVVHDATVRVDG